MGEGEVGAGELAEGRKASGKNLSGDWDVQQSALGGEMQRGSQTRQDRQPSRSARAKGHTDPPSDEILPSRQLVHPHSPGYALLV